MLCFGQCDTLYTQLFPIYGGSERLRSQIGQTSNRSSKFGCNWTSFHGEKKKTKTANARVWGDARRDQRPETRLFVGPHNYRESHQSLSLSFPTVDQKFTNLTPDNKRCFLKAIHATQPTTKTTHSSEHEGRVPLALSQDNMGETGMGHRKIPIGPNNGPTGISKSCPRILLLPLISLAPNVIFS